MGSLPAPTAGILAQHATAEPEEGMFSGDHF